MTTAQQTFDEAVNEWIERTAEMIGKEGTEDTKPPPPYDRSGPPFEAPVRLDSRLISRHVIRVGNDDPLFADPEYGKSTRYGCQLAPGTMLGIVRTPQHHGAVGEREGGYPLLTFFSGVAYEFFDVVRVGTRVRSSQILREMLEKRSDAQGRIFVLVTEVPYWDFHGDLLGVCRCTEIIVPKERRGVENYAAGTMYERKESTYTQAEVEKLIEQIESEPKRRGADTRYWEDVEVGDEMQYVYRPHTLYDMAAAYPIRFGGATFEGVYQRIKQGDKALYPVRTHPVSGWPYTGNAEHPDPILAPYRGQATSFDSGPDRVQIVPQLVTNWMGDDGFLARYYVANRRTVYYGDAIVYHGKVTKKFKRTHQGEEGEGAVPGKAEYCAVGIRIESSHPGGMPVEGTATVYLQSRESGPVRLPIPHSSTPERISYETYRSDWY